MTPVDQTILHDPANNLLGNCYQACLATILDLPIAVMSTARSWVAEPDHPRPDHGRHHRRH